MWKRVGLAGLLAAVASAAACGGSSDSSNPSSGGSSSGGSSGSDGGGAGGAAGASSGGAAGTSSGGSAGQSALFLGHCGDPVPAGAVTAAAAPSYAGTCPSFVAGENTISSSGNDRKFLLALPKDLKPTEHPPLVFLWHWLGGSAQDFYDKGEIQAAVDLQRFIAVIPEKKGDTIFVWPYTVSDSQARVDEEAKFFDDMLSCVSSQFTTDPNCVSSAGVSAGALWTDQLAGLRSQYLASFLSLSGGVGGVIKPWNPAVHHLPGLVLWGGPTDNCQGLLSFTDLSHALEDALDKDGHFYLECIHNCGHSEPPLDAPAGGTKYQMLWDFVLDHPYWTSPGHSPYSKNGLPTDFPSWCGIGKGSATPRTGACVNPSAC